MDEVVLVVRQFLTGARRDLAGLDEHGITPETLGHVRPGHNSCGRSIAHAAAVKKAQRPGDYRGCHYLLKGHLTPHMSLLMQGAIVVTLHRDLGQSPLALFRGELVL